MRRDPNSYDNPIHKQTAQTLEHIDNALESLGENITNLLEDVAALEDSLYFLEQALEMNLWVPLKLQLDGFPGPEQIVATVSEYQQQYLATVALISFIQYLNK